MAIRYRLYKCNNSRMSSAYGKWYARAVNMSEVHTDQLADIVQRNCSLKKSDVKGVIEELIEVMRDQLLMSNRVVLDGFGAFKVGITTSGTVTAGEWSAAQNVKTVRVNFQPAVTVDADGKRVKSLLMGAKVQELPVNNEIADETTTDAGTGA